MKIAYFLIVTLVFMTGGALCCEFYPTKIKSIDDNIKCFYKSVGLKATSIRPCDGYASPKAIAVGESFVANGKERKIGFIKMLYADSDMHYYGINSTKDDVICAASELKSDIDDENKAGMWLYITKCDAFPD
jgi:hypothetical protein